MPSILRHLLLQFACASAVSLGLAAVTSELWGERGEKWRADGRLPDFSRAGYQRGEKPIPDVPQVANVKDFGAVGDGGTDDTAAIRAALEQTPRGAIYFPAGRYMITDYIRVTRSNIVLRGAGAARTVLWFPRGLDEVHPKPGRTSSGSPASGYSFDGAFVSLQGDYQAKPAARIITTARRGDRSVQVNDPAGLAVGRTVLVVAREASDHSLKTFLYNGDPGDIRRGKQLDTKMLMRVVAVDGNQVTFDRALRFETRPEWQPEIRSFLPTVTESGIEDIGFEFPGTRYGGHFKENGANALELRQVFNCWIRNVAIHNADFGINIVACNNTVDGVVITADSGRGMRDGGVMDCTGHHAIQCKRAEDNLITRFDVRASYIHDLTVEHASGNVYSSGRGTDLNFDHHKDTPYENLFTDLDCGRGTRVWRCGGGASLGRQSAGWETFWNIRTAQPVSPPPPGWGAPSMNFIGLSTKTPPALAPDGIWLEPFAPGQLNPPNLHAAQLAERVKKSAR
jgi:hypothetical protein